MNCWTYCLQNKHSLPKHMFDGIWKFFECDTQSVKFCSVESFFSISLYRCKVLNHFVSFHWNVLYFLLFKVILFLFTGMQCVGGVKKFVLGYHTVLVLRKRRKCFYFVPLLILSIWCCKTVNWICSLFIINILRNKWCCALFERFERYDVEVLVSEKWENFAKSCQWSTSIAYRICFT